jgi:hypothetical protein
MHLKRRAEHKQPHAQKIPSRKESAATASVNRVPEKAKKTAQ